MKSDLPVRVLSSIVITIIAFGVFLGNIYLVDICVAIFSIRCIKELFNAFEQKNHHPVKMIGYSAAASISLLHLIPDSMRLLLIGAIIASTILISFVLTILKKTKTDIVDISLTFFGVCYIVLFLMFLSIIRNMSNGIWLIWYVFISSWLTDVFAYFAGRTIGKHHFTDISPKKTIEGCLGGIIGSTICMLIYTVILNHFSGLSISYIGILIASIFLSIIGQIGDLAASVIKRYAGIKDYSNLIPNHGGLLDRFDSVIFIAPFAYFVLLVLI